MKRLLSSALMLLFVSWTYAQVYLSQDFESGMGEWQDVAMNTDNSLNLGIKSLTEAHSGDYYFQFSSYNRSDDYNQYLISPVLELSNNANLEFYYKDIDRHGHETFTIMTSTTNDDLSSFTTISETITAHDNWTYGSCLLPADTKYVAFHYTASYEYSMGLDDISITVLGTNPEVALYNVILPEVVYSGEDFYVQGTLMNNSSTILTMVDVTCNVDGSSVTQTLHDLSVEGGDMYTFSFPSPLNISSDGICVVQMALSNPNGQPDYAEDNVREDSILVCNIISSLPYEYDFERGLGCWQAFSATNDNSVGISTSFAHSGSKSFRFCSWNNASDYSQYLISPQLSISSPMRFSFYAKDVYGYGRENIQVIPVG